MKNETIKRIAACVWHYKMLLFSAVVCASISVVLGLLVPVYIGKGIDEIVGYGDVGFDAVFGNLVVVLVLAGFCALFQWVMLVCARKISALVASDMRRQAFSSMNVAPLATIDKHAKGDVVSRFVNDADHVAEGLLQALSQLFPGVATIIATIIMMLSLNKSIALVVILATPVSIFFARFIAKRTSEVFRLQGKAQGRLSGYVNEAVKGQDVLQAFGYEEKAQKEFEMLSKNYYEANFKATFYSSLSNPGTRFINAIIFAVACAMGAIAAIGGNISIGGVSVFLSYATQYTKPFNDVSAVLTQIQSGVASAERLFSVAGWKAEIKDDENALAPTHSDGNVSAKNVQFAYEKNKPLIKNFSFDVKSGQRIALVGPTGSGKTTVINLLMRFYEIQKGEIFIDDVQSKSIKRNSLRNLFGMVLQETWLKQASVLDNIAYGNKQAAYEEVVQAAKDAKAHGFITRLPKGYDTVLEAGGSNLSAGQRQLLCIARIMLAKPHMLILDEATSSIDTRTEMLIQRALEKLMKGHTSFVVAHRLSTIQNADCILYMQAGEILERGTHEELLAKNGLYAKLYNSQFALEKEEGQY